MKKILINVILIFITLTTQAQVEINELENRNGIYYEVGKDIPFTGESYTFYSDGKKESFAEFINGKLNGEMKNWYPNGEIQVFGKMVKGKKNGIWTSWFSNGNKLREGTYKDNKEEGVFTWWYENGNIKKKGLYQNGITNGQWTWYFNNGVKESEGNLLNDKNIGKWFWWNNKGEIIHEKDFPNEVKNIDFKSFEKLLIGEWVFIKTLDKNGNEVKHIIQDYNGPDGKEIKIVAKGPDIIMNSDHSYIKKFTESNSDFGNWKILSENEIEFEMVIPKDSKQGNMIVQTQKILGKKWKTDKKGNFLDASIDKILSLSENKMEVEYEKDYVLIYRKK